MLFPSSTAFRSHNILNIVQEGVQSLIDGRAGLALIFFEFLVFILDPSALPSVNLHQRIAP